MTIIKRILLLSALMTYWAYALPAGISSIVNKSGIPRSDISIYIKEVGKKGRELASLNADTARSPASVIKVMSTYAAVLKLGFDYKWPTNFYTKGKIKNGVLQGDLIVKGFGDPTLSSRDLPGIVAKIKAKGIRKITGNIVIDRSYFKVSTKNTSGFDKNTYSAYNAMPDAMMFNERVSTICVTPNKNTVVRKGADQSYVVTNNLKRVNKPCRGRYSWPAIRIDDSAATTKVVLRGSISKNCGKRNICKVITKPYKSFYYALKDALKKAGVSVNGNMRINKVPSGAKSLFTHYSKSLEKIVSKTAKKSNNLYARHLLLYLGAKMYGAPATLSKGQQAVKYILKSRLALHGSTLKIDNGSGLSRTSRLTAKGLAYMFDDAYTRYGTRWMKTLSIAGVDGTIKRRFRGTVVRNRAWMKTGTLNRVKNIGGYVKSKSGRMYTVVILVNTKQGRWKASQLQNNIMKWLVKYKGRGTRSVSDYAGSIKTMSMKKSSDSYYVQTGSFAQAPTKTYLDNIKKLGLTYETEKKDNYKVLVGPYSAESDARKILQKVRKNINKDAFLVAKTRKKKEDGSILY